MKTEQNSGEFTTIMNAACISRNQKLQMTENGSVNLRNMSKVENEGMDYLLKEAQSKLLSTCPQPQLQLPPQQQPQLQLQLQRPLPQQLLQHQVIIITHMTKIMRRNL